MEYTEIGVFTKDIDGRTFITAILDGSPAAKAGLKVGDQVQLMTVSMSPIQSFVDKADKEVEISIQQTWIQKSIKKKP